ncbi:MAG: hypothetical protein KGY50_05230, partial [Candidatus Thermoplasmatota archaeon]|nr:hypothetical protein [Candidatus Thermoplasmatota archaeon]
MKRNFCIILASILLVSSIGFVSIADETNIDVIKTSYSFSNICFQEQNDNIHISLDKANSYILNTGKPLLPSHIETYTFPSKTKIKNVYCEPVDIQYKTLTKDVENAPAIMQLGTNKIIEARESTELSNYYPHEWYDVTIGHGLYKGQRSTILKIEFYPVKYHQEYDKLMWADEIDVLIEYESDDTILQYDEKYDLLIISPDEFTDQLDTLVTHKNSRNISTNLVSLEEIYDGTYFSVQGRDDPEKIKYFIKNAYDEWGITNVLLVGGIIKLPSRNTHIKVSDDDTEIFVSDLYYADIYNESLGFSTWDTNNNDVFAEYNWEGNTDEIDLFPDVRIGRIACIDENQVEIIVNKIINYENTEAYAQDWFSEIVVIGGDTSPNDEKGIDEGEFVNQAIIDTLTGFSADKIWYTNGRLGGISPTGIQNINNGINSGSGFVDFSGHGGSGVWTTYPHNGSRQTLPTPTGRYTNSIIGNLENGDKLPIVFCGGCSLGKFQADANCFAWSFLSNPNGGGIASFGATGLGYIYIGQYVTYALVEGLNLKIVEAYDQGAISFGEIWLDGVNDYITSINLDAVDYKTLMEWHAFGDPTLAISDESEPPVTPEAPSGPSSGRIGEEYNYSASTTDPEGDDIFYFFEWSENNNSGWLGPFASGETCTASVRWSERGNYQIRVRAKDDHGSISGWSDPLEVAMPKNNVFNPVMWNIERIFQRFPQL